MRKLIGLYFFTTVLMFMLAQSFFEKFQDIYSKNILKTTQSLFSREENLINPLKISQSLADLNRLGIMDCIDLIRSKDNFNFFRLYNNTSSCQKLSQLEGKLVTNQFQSANGTSWKISFLATSPLMSDWFINLCRFVLFLISTIIFGAIYLRERQHLKINKLIKENTEWKYNLSMQVSHDIRSPLAALRMATEEAENIPTEYRNIIRMSVQRINDIANNLLSSTREETRKNNGQHEVELLPSLIDSLISEKRMSMRHKTNIQIESDLINSYGLFASINAIELKRVLSNLINNSIEAIDLEGKVRISASETSDGQILIRISDSGKGMPKHVLKKLGEKGFSYGKTGNESGNGLGIFHARETIEGFGGELRIDSTEEKGTDINIILPKAPTPLWFVKNISLLDGKKVLILDDEESMLKAWAERLPISTDNFTNGHEFSIAVKNLVTKDFLILIDYELSGQPQTGLDLIKSLGIEKQSILVTSRFEEKEIRDKCISMGIQIIPKMMASIVPIIHSPKLLNQFDCVFIDDEEIMRILWESKAKKKNLNLLTIASTKDFELYLDKINKESTYIYIDSNLGKGKISGEEFAKTLHDQGYKNLLIASGYEASHFNHLDWLKYCGKDCPF